jgi:hypothetical protein
MHICEEIGSNYKNSLGGVLSIVMFDKQHMLEASLAKSHKVGGSSSSVSQSFEDVASLAISNVLGQVEAQLRTHSSDYVIEWMNQYEITLKSHKARAQAARELIQAAVEEIPKSFSPLNVTNLSKRIHDVLLVEELSKLPSGVHRKTTTTTSSSSSLPQQPSRGAEFGSWMQENRAPPRVFSGPSSVMAMNPPVPPNEIHIKEGENGQITRLSLPLLEDCFHQSVTRGSKLYLQNTQPILPPSARAWETIPSGTWLELTDIPGVVAEEKCYTFVVIDPINKASRRFKVEKFFTALPPLEDDQAPLSLPLEG